MNICETATGCIDAGGFRVWADERGFPFCKVFDWTNSAGDWSIIVSRNGKTWFPMYQTNNWPRRGFDRIIDLEQPMDGTAEEVFEFIALTNEF